LSHVILLLFQGFITSRREAYWIAA